MKANAVRSCHPSTGPDAGWNIPLSIQEYYGLTEDYRLFHQLEGMAPDEYLRKRQTGEVPDILEVDARLTHAVEKIFESVCPVIRLNTLTS